MVTSDLGEAGCARFFFPQFTLNEEDGVLDFRASWRVVEERHICVRHLLKPGLS